MFITCRENTFAVKVTVSPAVVGATLMKIILFPVAGAAAKQYQATVPPFLQSSLSHR